jgi:hypothetical protein
MQMKMYLLIIKGDRFCYLTVIKYQLKGNKIVFVTIKLLFSYLLVTNSNYNNINNLIVILGILLPSLGISGLC